MDVSLFPRDPARRNKAGGGVPGAPDLTRPGQVCGMTAQHAQRQGKQVARNVAATLGKGKAEPYKHADLGSPGATT
jgi:NADH dehydrogenase